LLRGLVDLAVRHRAPVAMHVAETRSELELLSKGTGSSFRFLSSLRRLAIRCHSRGSRPLDYLRSWPASKTPRDPWQLSVGKKRSNFLATHPNISVVYCPRTHAFFKHDPHPWLKLVERGINVALGTDQPRPRS